MAITFEFGEEIQERIENSEKVIDYLNEHYPNEKVRATLTYPENTMEKRVSVSSGELFVYARGRRRWGNYLRVTSSHIKAITIPEKRKSKEDIWRDSWQTVVDYLDESGLWQKYADKYRAGLEVGLETIRTAERLYWQRYDIEDAVEKVKALKDGEKLIRTNNEGTEFIDTEIVWYMSAPAKVKTIYFGKYRTDKIREALKEAMEAGEEFSEFEAVRNYYDCSVRFNPKIMQGWYSEEYRNCGNGHYYILLDHEHALFVEDD